VANEVNSADDDCRHHDEANEVSARIVENEPNEAYESIVVVVKMKMNDADKNDDETSATSVVAMIVVRVQIDADARLRHHAHRAHWRV
jgi:hypothetical protein